MVVLNGLVRPSTPEQAFAYAALYFFTLYFTVVAVTVPFLYRYCLICRYDTFRE